MHPLHRQIYFDWALPGKFYAAMFMVWISRPDLQRTFPLHKMRQADYVKFLNWCTLHGRLEYTLLAELPAESPKAEVSSRASDSRRKLSSKLNTVKFLALSSIESLLDRFAPSLPKVLKLPSRSDLQYISEKLCDVRDSAASRKMGEYPFGVNLFGYAAGELGIGEDVRMLAYALESANVPFCIINVAPGSNVSQNDLSVQHWVVDAPVYAVNIFCMTGFETCRYILETGLANTERRYNVGLWPWELENWPNEWRHAYTLVDEIWGISEYASRAYSNAPVPVLPMPLPVVIGDVAPLNRAHWNLPPEAYLFVFSFDMNSTLSRKNPQAVIQAFKQAAKHYRADEVGLVLKISHIESNKLQWREIQRLIADDNRIYVVPVELRKPEVMALYSCCDCYVSLHRSEGFGRSLAEAQLLGLSLIATGYSGNLDFCSPPTHLVDYELVGLGANDYPNGDGQHWAEPSIEHAASLMQKCIEQEDDRSPVDYPTGRFSTKFCGQRYRDRLRQIMQGNACS